MCCGLPTTPTTTRSKIAAARAITSTWPIVTGSYEPGQIAVIMVLEQGKPRGTVPARGADGSGQLRLRPRAGLEDEQAVGGEQPRQVLRERLELVQVS